MKMLTGLLPQEKAKPGYPIPSISQLQLVKNTRLHCITARLRNFLRVFLIMGLAPLITSQIITEKLHAQTGQTFVVNTLGDAEDPDGNDFSDGHCDADPNTPGDQCTFRAAIQNHNANRNLDHNTIIFAIPNAPGSGSIVIMVGSSGNGALPPVLGSVTIVGLNTVGPSRRIEINGSQAGAGAMGLKLLGGKSDISFFIINNFASNGIYISGTPIGDGGHNVHYNFIGTDSTGTVAAGNGGDGIFIDNTPNNLIGGSGVLDGNVICSNGGYGIRIAGPDTTVIGQTNRATGNNLYGNKIGQNFLENNFLPNGQGGIQNDNAPQNNIGGTGTNQGNKIVGQNNGITVQGSLSKGVRVEGNFVGRDGTTAKFLAGIFARSGELLTVTGNIITNIGDVGMDIFLDANSTYDIKKNQINGDVKIGSKFTFGQGRVITVNYQDNIHFKNSTGLMIDESINSTINWLITGDTVLNGQNGGNIKFRSAGTKQLNNNEWKLNAGVGCAYAVDFAAGVKASIIVNGDLYLQNGAEGMKGNVHLDAQAEVVFTLSKITGSSNGKDGLALGLAASAGAKGDLKINGGSDFSLNAAAALRLMGEKSSLDIFRVEVDRINATRNKDIDVTLYFLNINLRHSVTNSKITDNTGAGIVLDGATEASIDNDTIENNGNGIVMLDAAVGTVTNNIISGNKTGVVLAGNGTGTSLTSNSIFGNATLGIDLGNDGVTANDNGDADTGPNNLQNFPVLTSVNSSGGSTSIAGTLNSTANTIFNIQFFTNDHCSPSGFGEGQILIGSKQVTTDGGGNATFVALINGVTLANGASVTATATDANNNTSEFSKCIQAEGTPESADLELTKKVDKSQITVGGTVVFTVTLSNKGPANGTGIVVTDKIPAGISITDVTTSTGVYDKNTSVWAVGSVVSGGQATLTATGTTTQTGNITNTAEVTAAGQPDPDSSPNNHNPNEDDQATVTVQVTPQQGAEADLEITKTANRTQVGVGDQIIFTISIFNRGPATATNIQVRDIIPSAVSLTNVKVSAGTYNATTGIWKLNHLFKGAHAVATFTGNTTKDGVFENTAEVVASDQKDTDSSPGNNNPNEDDQATVVIRSLLTKPADLELNKQVDKAIVVSGDDVNFTITLSNKGPETATGIAVKDLSSKGLVFNKVIASAGSFDITTGIWTVSQLTAGASETLMINATTMIPGTLTNTAEVAASDQPDPDSSPDNGISTEDDQSSVNVKSLQTTQADLELSLTASTLQAAPGDQVTITGILFNRGPATATNIILSEIAPAGLTFNAVKISAGTYTASNGTWKINHLFKGAKAYITITATVTQTGNITNTAEVILTDQSDPDSSPNNHNPAEDDQASITIQSSAAIARKAFGNNLHQQTDKAGYNQEKENEVSLTAYPNPVNASTTVHFYLPAQSRVQLVVVNAATGRIVSTIIANQITTAGNHSIRWQMPYLASGIYILQLKTDHTIKTLKLLSDNR
ncbi:NosD domain-containing protein [Danxiaibacter flavus]|uniref:NosD domain-containing protein n=1 Tax=Danxiaibacter flavus TaxID=3049108 RepID=A0ABV3ZL30_9BACT|nr:NosD domain-containing protein [Chitinophagaceae bacterium DXS]